MVEEVDINTYFNTIEGKSIFQKKEFYLINRKKTKSLFFLLFKDSKYRAGIIFGLKENSLFSHFSAPFGGITFINSKITLKKIDEIFSSLANWAEKKNFKIVITLPPFFYENSLSEQVNCAIRNSFKIKHLDINYHFDLSKFNDEYLLKIWANARNKLKKAKEQKLRFIEVFTNKEKLVAYEIIKKNREEKKFDLKMSFNDVIRNEKLISSNFFLVIFNDNPIASAMCYKTTNNIAQLIYWGNIQEYIEINSMNFLSFEILKYYKKNNFKIFDFGPSSKNSIANFGLCDFKKSIGSQTSLKITLEK